MSQTFATSFRHLGAPTTAYQGRPRFVEFKDMLVRSPNCRKNVKPDLNPYRHYYKCSYAASKMLISDSHKLNWIDTASIQEIEQLQYEFRLLAEEVQMLKRLRVGYVGFDYGELANKLDTMGKALVESKSKKKKKMMVVIFCACVIVIGMMVKSKVA